MITTHCTSTQSQTAVFARDVLNGLEQSPKRLPSKYFYDTKGDELFQQIMHMPEYYLMNSELDIFQSQKQDILATIGHTHFDLIELGAGDGYKTKVLLEYFLQEKVHFTYEPIDISANVLEQLEESLHQRWPSLNVAIQPGDYFKMLHKLSKESSRPKLVLFLGANIGNYTPQEARGFLQSIFDELNPGDYLLLGVDLKKDPKVILDAYNDQAGITAAFNLNLLSRINRELGANFEKAQFKHWETYNPVTGATKSYIVSTCDQHVFINALNRSFHFSAWEAMEVELSQKYDLHEINSLAAKAGFIVKKHFTDQQECFVDSLWQKPV